MASSARVTSFPLHLFIKTISATFPAVFFFRSRDVAGISSEGAAPSVRPHRKVLFAVLSRAAVPPGRSLSHACTPARFFAHATFLRRQRERSSLSGLAGLLSGWVPPVIRQSVFGTLEGRRRYVLGFFYCDLYLSRWSILSVMSSWSLCTLDESDGMPTSV